MVTGLRVSPRQRSDSLTSSALHLAHEDHRSTKTEQPEAQEIRDDLADGAGIGHGSGPALQVGEVECGAQPLREFLRVVIGPEVHEEEVRRVVDHVAVQRRHFDAVLAQRLEHRVDFAPEQHEVAR